MVKFDAVIELVFLKLKKLKLKDFLFENPRSGYFGGKFARKLSKKRQKSLN